MCVQMKRIGAAGREIGKISAVFQSPGTFVL
jgi:hypothetical protein